MTNRNGNDDDNDDDDDKLEEVYDDTEGSADDDFLWMTESAPARMNETRERLSGDKKMAPAAAAAVVPELSKVVEEEEKGLGENHATTATGKEEPQQQQRNSGTAMTLAERRAQRVNRLQRASSSSPVPPLDRALTAPAGTGTSSTSESRRISMPHPDISGSTRNLAADFTGNNSNKTKRHSHSSTTALHDERLTVLSAQMVHNQEQTIETLQELSKTIKNLMLSQLKRDKESEDDTKDMLNVDRATVRLDGLEVYAVVSALTVATAIACFDLYAGAAGDSMTNIFTAGDLHWGNITPLILNSIFLGVSGVGIIAGLHATLVFSLMTMYGRTAVGVSHDEAFVEFFVQTGRVRYRGFHTFRLSLYCFLIQVLFTITSRSPPILRPFVVLINCVSIYWVYRDTQSVIDKAGDILFNFSASNAANQRQDSDSEGHLSLKRTLSDNNAGRHRASTTAAAATAAATAAAAETTAKESNNNSTATDPVDKPIPAAQNGAGGGGGSFLANMRQRAIAGAGRGGAGGNKSKNVRAAGSDDEAPTVNGRYSRKKGVARSKSGVVVYDVGPAAPVRRGGRRPGH